MIRKVLEITALALILSSCASIRSMGLNIASPMIYEAGNVFWKRGTGTLQVKVFWVTSN